MAENLGTNTTVSPQQQVGRGEPDIKEPETHGSKLFVIGFFPWLLVTILWVIGGFMVARAYGSGVLLGYLVLFMGWLSKSVNIIKENEIAKSIFLGMIIKGIIGSGVTLTVWPFEILRRYPTGVQQLKIEVPQPLPPKGQLPPGQIQREGAAGIQTKREIVEIKNEAGKVLEKVVIPQIILPVTPIFNFQWPWTDEDLTAAIRYGPHPDDMESLKDKLEEPLLDVIRHVGGQRNYEWIIQNRITFAEEVTDRVKAPNKDLSDMINLFRLKNITVAFKHIELPLAIKQQQEVEAAARHTGAADRIKEREKRIGIGEGERSIREALATMLTNERFKDIGLTLEAMITLREMAREGKTTYALVPQNVYGALSRALGGPAEQMIGGLSEQDFKDLLEMAKKLKGDVK